MKKRNKVSIKVRDLDLLKDVTQGGRCHRSRTEALRAHRVGEYTAGLGPFGLNRPV